MFKRAFQTLLNPVRELLAAKAPARRAPEEIPMDAGLSGSGFEDIITRAMTPQEVETVLSGAVSGDLGQQFALYNSMLDTWGKLAANDRTLGDAVVGAPWTVKPWQDADGNVSDTAKAKAALVEAALAGMAPRPDKTSELGRDGMLRALVRGALTGHQILQIVWHQAKCEGKTAWLPRAVKRVGTRHYGYEGNSRDLRYRGAGGGFTDFPDGHFLIHVSPAHEGHPSQGGRWRTLCKYWGGITYAWEWLMTHCNKFGMPFRWVEYDPNARHLVPQIIAMLGSLGAAGYAAFPRGTKLNLHEAGKSGEALPMSFIMKLADQAADLIFLGETRTSGGDEGGGFSDDGEQGKVRRAALQGYCNNILPPLNQLVHHVLMWNYGECSECPEIVCEIPEPEDAGANATTDSTLNSLGLPLRVDDLYERHDKNPPADGDVVLLKGEIVRWSETHSIKDPAEAAAPGPDKKANDGKGKKEITAAKGVPDGMTLEGVIERLLLGAIIEGAEDFEDAARGEREEAAKNAKDAKDAKAEEAVPQP